MRPDRQGKSASSFPHGFTAEHYLRLRKIEAIDGIGRIGARYGFLTVIAFLGYSSIRVLAGKTTLAEIAVRFITNIRVSAGISYAVGGGGVAYGWLQKRLRGNGIKKMAAHIKELEEQIDPGRSSSGLTERGETRPEDKT